jgi:hypothetical protein
MDPMADKALMIIVTVTLAVKGAIPREYRSSPEGVHYFLENSSSTSLNRRN